MLSTRIYIVLIALCWLDATVFAQSDFVVPPEGASEPPAWGTPAPPPGFAPIPATPMEPGQVPSTAEPGQVPSYDDDSYFIPVEPSQGFDGFRDEDDPYMGFGSAGSRGPREVKDSFKFVETAPEKKCLKWKNDLHGPKTFPSQRRCEMELERQVERGLAQIESVVDQVELFKLKKVIRGEIADRSEAKQYSIGFDSLIQSLQSAAKQGCTCSE